MVRTGSALSPNVVNTAEPQGAARPAALASNLRFARHAGCDFNAALHITFSKTSATP